MSWFDSIKKWFESTKDWFGEIIEAAGKDDVLKKWAVIGGIVLAVVVAVVCLYICCKYCCAFICGRRRRGRTMKAPGRDGLMIHRDPFERNPRDYFQRLRNKEPWDGHDGELLV
ncbi:hypothetical protein QN277_029018 [Acacia crassicarpa]|uniref:Uncharacterized protein n=1 Tax=Acacia crassicarpa TaxID=499986 RepID=A0AAE1K483_9FABA|nr:hypothetical protein QN277_029018 [Acacia crassicarpa]